MQIFYPVPGSSISDSYHCGYFSVSIDPTPATVQTSKKKKGLNNEQSADTYPLKPTANYFFVVVLPYELCFFCPPLSTTFRPEILLLSKSLWEILNRILDLDGEFMRVFF